MSFHHAMEQLQRLPMQTVRSRGRISTEAAVHWAQASGQKLALVDLSNASDKQSVLTAIGEALGFPAWYGVNLDALYDCLADLPERAELPSGWMVLLEGWSRSVALSASDRRAVLDVFRDAARIFAERGIPFRVLYA